MANPRNSEASGDPREVSSPDAGFTIIELMIVMVMLGILAGIILFAVSPFADDANASNDTTVDRECTTAAVAAQADAANGGSRTIEDFTQGGCVSP